jgi:hypothetical protein
MSAEPIFSGKLVIAVCSQDRVREKKHRCPRHCCWPVPPAENAGGFHFALQKLLADVRAGEIDVVLVYKVYRLTRSLADFANIEGAGQVLAYYVNELRRMVEHELKFGGLNHRKIGGLGAEFGRCDGQGWADPVLPRRHGPTKEHSALGF